MSTFTRYVREFTLLKQDPFFVDDHNNWIIKDCDAIIEHVLLNEDPTAAAVETYKPFPHIKAEYGSRYTLTKREKTFTYVEMLRHRIKELETLKNLLSL